MLAESLASRVPEEKHVAYLADWWAHTVSYLNGTLGGVYSIVRT